MSQYLVADHLLGNYDLFVGGDVANRKGPF
jgi:hypothetical protein